MAFRVVALVVGLVVGQLADVYDSVVVGPSGSTCPESEVLRELLAVVDRNLISVVLELSGVAVCVVAERYTLE